MLFSVANFEVNHSLQASSSNPIEDTFQFNEFVDEGISFLPALKDRIRDFVAAKKTNSEYSHAIDESTSSNAEPVHRNSNLLHAPSSSSRSEPSTTDGLPMLMAALNKCIPTIRSSHSSMTDMESKSTSSRENLFPSTGSHRERSGSNSTNSSNIGSDSGQDSPTPSADQNIHHTSIMDPPNNVSSGSRKRDLKSASVVDSALCIGTGGDNAAGAINNMRFKKGRKTSYQESSFSFSPCPYQSPITSTSYELDKSLEGEMCGGDFESIQRTAAMLLLFGSGLRT